MKQRGRPTKPRTSELGRYLQDQRFRKGWSLIKLADISGVPHNAVSRLELGRHSTRDENRLLEIAKALEVHPDTLLRKACLTGVLKPAKDSRPSLPSNLVTFSRQVSEAECHALENYLDFLRYSDRVSASVSRILSGPSTR